MAKKDEQKTKTNGNAGQKSRMKVFVAGFEMEGGDDVMAEGFKAIRELTTAMSRGAAVLAPAAPAKPALAAPKTGTVIAPEVHETFETDEEPREDLEPAIEEEEEGVGEAVEPSNGDGKGPKRNYTFKAPKFLHDLDLSKAAKPLAEFMSEKGNPTDVTDQYIVIAVWLKEHMSVDEFTIAHIWTAYSFLNWKAQFPQNHSQPLRDLSKKNFLTKEKSGYKVSWPGEQYVTKLGA